MSVIINEPSIILNKINEVRLNLNIPPIIGAGFLFDLCDKHLKNLMQQEVKWNEDHLDILIRKTSGMINDIQEIQIVSAFINIPYLLKQYEILLKSEYNRIGLTYFNLGNKEFIYLLIGKSL